MINEKIGNRSNMYYHTMTLDFIAETCICTDIGQDEQWEYLLDTSELFTAPLSQYLEKNVREPEGITFTAIPSVRLCKGLSDGIKHIYLVEKIPEKI